MEPDFRETKVKAVIFDFDGVICNTEPLHAKSWQMLFARKGIHVPEERIWGAVGTPDYVFLQELFEEYRLNDSLQSWEVEKRNIFLLLLRQNVPSFPGAVELVRRLGWNWPLGIASTSWRVVIEFSLQRLGIRGCFQAIVGKEDVTEHKPSPEPYLRAAADLGEEPQGCVAIEDSPAGITAARAAGMPCIAVANSFPPDKLPAADLVVPSLEQADAVIAFLLGHE